MTFVPQALLGQWASDHPGDLALGVQDEGGREENHNLNFEHQNFLKTSQEAILWKNPHELH